jgi:hypothetical protein
MISANDPFGGAFDGAAGAAFIGAGRAGTGLAGTGLAGTGLAGTGLAGAVFAMVGAPFLDTGAAGLRA